MYKWNIHFCVCFFFSITIEYLYSTTGGNNGHYKWHIHSVSVPSTESIDRHIFIPFLSHAFKIILKPMDLSLSLSIARPFIHNRYDMPKERDREGGETERKKKRYKNKNWLIDSKSRIRDEKKYKGKYFSRFNCYLRYKICSIFEKNKIVYVDNNDLAISASHSSIYIYFTFWWSPVADHWPCAPPVSWHCSCTDNIHVDTIGKYHTQSVRSTVNSKYTSNVYTKFCMREKTGDGNKTHVHSQHTLA